ncbi:MAG TPA: diguanylate cyclase, partial [Casimicrobiaceae bacterium]
MNSRIPQPPPPPLTHPEGFIGRVVLFYALFSALWILASGWIAGLFAVDRETLNLIDLVKGWVFVAITSGLLYGL